MSIIKVIEVLADSPKGWEDAAQNALAQNGASYHWERPQGSAQATLRVNGSRGMKQFDFAAGQAVSINASSLSGDGTYRWELVFAPAISASLQ